MINVLADSSLSPSEKEDKKIEGLINKETPRSRKYVEKRGPKHDNRKRRITDEDNDLNSNTVEGDRDMSLNYKYSADDLLSFIALIVADSKSESKELEAAIQTFWNDLREVSSDLANEFKSYAKSTFKLRDKSTYLSSPRLTSLAKKYIDVLEKDRKYLKIKRNNLVSALNSADTDSIADIVAASWPNNDTEFSERAAIIGALKKVIKQVPLPESLKIPFMRKGIKDVINDKQFIKYLIEASHRGLGRTDNELIPRFAQLVAAYQIVVNNPGSINLEDLQKGMDKLISEVSIQFKELADLSYIMKDWHNAISQFKHDPKKKLELGKSSKDYDKVIKSIDEFMNAESKVIDLDSYKEEMEKYAEENYGGVPDDMKSILRAATSNKKIPSKNMHNRSAQYHGVVQQRANPVQTTNTGYRSYDKRYFGKDHYNSILKCAQDILKDDGWFKSGWDEGFEDASFRAALDLAIHTADDSLYQSKVDVEQYNILLNKLAKWGHKTFSDTVLPFKAGEGLKRKASMKQSQKAILQIANDIRNSNPEASVALLKVIRANEEIEFQALPEKEFKDLQKEMEGTIKWDSTDLNGFMKSFDEAFDLLQSKVAAYVSPLFRKVWASRSRVSSIRVANLDPKLVNQWIEEAKSKLDKLFTEEDFNEFLEGFEDMYSEIHEDIEKQASAVVHLGDIVQLANANPESRAALIPFIVSQKESHIAAVKNGKKKKTPPFGKKKKEEEEEEDKKGKKKSKAKDKKTSKKGKRKASYTPADIDW